MTSNAGSFYPTILVLMEYIMDGDYVYPPLPSVLVSVSVARMRGQINTNTGAIKRPLSPQPHDRVSHNARQGAPLTLEPVFVLILAGVCQ